MDNITCQPVMLPATTGNGEGSIHAPWLKSLATWLPQHLYLVSDREIKEGDWMLMKAEHPQGKIRRCWEVYSAYSEYGDGEDQLMIDDPKDRKRGFGFLRRGEVSNIEAITDRSLGIPLIPESWIKDVYVPSQGKIDKVKIAWDKWQKGAILENAIAPGVAYVIILPIKDSWNKEDMKKAWDVGAENGGIHNTLSISFNEWLDKNY